MLSIHHIMKTTAEKERKRGMCLGKMYKQRVEVREGVGDRESQTETFDQGKYSLWSAFELKEWQTSEEVVCSISANLSLEGAATLQRQEEEEFFATLFYCFLCCCEMFPSELHNIYIYGLREELNQSTDIK